MAKKRSTTGITAKLTDSKGRVLAEDKGDGAGLQQVGDNLAESLAEMHGLPAPRILYDEQGRDYRVPVGDKGKVKFDRTGTESVRYSFSDKEIAELSRKAGEQRLSAQSIKARLDSIKKSLQGEIDSLEAAINNLLQKCRDGYEYREADTGTIFHVPVKGQKAIVQLSTMEVLRTAPMLPHELQAEMQFEEPEEATATMTVEMAERLNNQYTEPEEGEDISDFEAAEE